MPRPIERRTERLNLRLTKEEMAQLERDADTAAVSISDIARAQILNAAIPKRARRKSVDHEALARVLVQLSKVGGNINQIAKVANTNGDLSAVRETNALKAELVEIRRMVRDAIAP